MSNGGAPARDPSSARSLKVGLVLPLFSGDAAKVVAAARSAEDLGFDGVFAFDHFFPPGAEPDRPALEAFTILAGVAAATSRVALGTLVTRAVLRPPGLLAKQAATVDLIAGGRMILGLGTGDPIDRPEHRVFGFPDLSKSHRRAHLAETAAALRALFRGQPYEGGSFIPPLRGPLVPPPERPGGPPIWIGAQSDEVVRIAGELADGWNGWGLEPQAFERKAAILAEQAGRTGRRVEATWAGIVLLGEDDTDVARLLEDRRRRGMGDGLAWSGPAESFASYANQLGAAGAHWVITVLAGPAGRRELAAERVLPLLR